MPQMNLQACSDIEIMSMIRNRTHHIKAAQLDLQSLQQEMDRRVAAHDQAKGTGPAAPAPEMPH